MTMLALRIVFLCLFTALFAAAHVYLYHRLFKDVSARPQVHRLGRWIMGALFAGLLVRVAFMAARVNVGQVGAWVANGWLGWMLYLTLTLLALRVISWPLRRTFGVEAEAGTLTRRQLLARATAGGAVAASSAVAGYGLLHAFIEEPLHTEVALRLPRLPKSLDGLKVVQLTDIHLGDILGARFLQLMVDRTNAQRPDLVAITGDLVDGSVQRLGPVTALLRGLRSRFGTFFCTGNHEYYSGVDDWAEELTRLDITVLRNRRVTVGDAGGSFDLMGVDDYGARKPRGHGYDLAAALEGRNPDRASVLLAHQPQSFPEAVRAGVGLQLSGHTHGGQLFPATTIAGLIYGPLLSGLHAEEGSHVFVSRGCGFWGPPMRVGSPPEVVTLHLLA